MNSLHLIERGTSSGVFRYHHVHQRHSKNGILPQLTLNPPVCIYSHLTVSYFACLFDRLLQDSDIHLTVLQKSFAMPDHINFVTGNANKLREVQAILEPGISVRSQPLDVDEVQGTVEEVTTAKTRKAAELVSTSFLIFV